MWIHNPGPALELVRDPDQETFFSKCNLILKTFFSIPFMCSRVGLRIRYPDPAPELERDSYPETFQGFGA